MTRKTLGIASAVAVIVMGAIAVAVATSLPGDVPLPTHWGVDGTADGFSDKWVALLLPAALAAGLSLMFLVLPSLEPRKEGLSRSQGLYHAAWGGTVLVMMLVQLAVVSAALHWPVHATSLVLGGVGLLFVLIGNQLGKSRSMYLIGVRTPWTLASEEVWIKTHRLAGKLMLLLGVLLVLAALAPLPSGLITTLLLAGVAAAVLIPVAYSYLLWRREQANGQAGG
jgi:uncharacterized membrane protein